MVSLVDLTNFVEKRGGCVYNGAFDLLIHFITVTSKANDNLGTTFTLMPFWTAPDRTDESEINAWVRDKTSNVAQFSTRIGSINVSALENSPIVKHTEKTIEIMFSELIVTYKLLMI